MISEFLGRGWAFPISPDAQTGIAMASYEESVRQSVWLILGTAKGERMMRPDFGCGIHELVFATATSATAGALAHEVRQALIQWEPRIEVSDIQVNMAGQGETILIGIEYRVRATNNAYNLVYPFYLEGSGA